MANYFTLTYDTTGPASPSISINSGATYATAVLVTATIGTTDGTTTGYQMKVWGDLDLAWCKTNGVVGAGATGVAEADALWITYATSKQLQLSTGDGTKTVYLKIRDDVNNPSAQASDTIILNTALPTVTISGPDVPKISKQTGKDTSSFTFQSDQIFTDYMVKVVSASGADNTTGTTIATTNGSTNTSGSAGNYSANTPITVTIKGADLEVASAGDGSKIIKVFCKNQAGQWSA
jgi:hypothetical protein